MDDAWAERIWMELHRIANVLEALIPEQTPESETPPCSHPTESRISLGMTNGEPEWICSLCKHHQIQSQPSDPATTIPAHP